MNARKLEQLLLYMRTHTTLLASHFILLPRGDAKIGPFYFCNNYVELLYAEIMTGTHVRQ